jgi:predicted acyltransferase
MAENIPIQSTGNRLLSLDFFRGLTMFLLIGTESGLYVLMQKSGSNFVSRLGWQFEHPDWIGLHFWDFVAPFFMFIVGVAIPFSVSKRLEKGESWKSVRAHAFLRFVVLFLLGIAIYSIDEGKPVFRLWNILTQVSVSYLIAFLLMRRNATIQIIVSLLLILISQAAYFIWQPGGTEIALIPDHNLGSWIDMKLMGTLQDQHWVSFNVVATSAYTIWGVLAGLSLQSGQTPGRKLKILVTAGLIGIISGLVLSSFIPFIKKIATASVVLETGGWCFVIMAISYWLVDLKMIRRVPGFFTVVGMNSLFIYFFAQIGIGAFLARMARPFSYTLFFWAGEPVMAYMNAFLTWFLLWYLCYFLYKNRIFIKV